MLRTHCNPEFLTYGQRKPLQNWDTAFFTMTPSGPGGASLLTAAPIGAGGVAPAGQLNPSQSPGAPSGRGMRIPPAVWVFVLLIVGYWGIHQSLKVV